MHGNDRGQFLDHPCVIFIILRVRAGVKGVQIQMTVYCMFNIGNFFYKKMCLLLLFSLLILAFIFDLLFSLTKRKGKKNVLNSKLFPSLMILFCRLKRSNFILEIYIKGVDHQTIYLCGLLFQIFMNYNSLLRSP